MKCSNKCKFFKKSVRDATTNEIFVICSFDGKLHPENKKCQNQRFEFKKEWHPVIYSIYRKEKNSASDRSRHYRVFTKTQLVYVVAGGTSLGVCIPYSQHRIITKARKNYVQITKWYYENHKLTFDQLMNFEDQQKLLRDQKKTKPITYFFGDDKN